MTEEQRNEILTTYKWIKVKKYVPDPSDPPEVQLEKLNAHHLEETNFLIEFIRNIVKDLPH